MNALSLRSFSLGLAGAVMLVLPACGGGAPDVRAPESRPVVEPEPTSIEEAQDQISRARDRLAGAAGGAQPDRPGGAPAAPSADAAPAEPSPLSPAPGAQTTTPESSGKAPSMKTGRGVVEESRCASPCRALASMRRAVTALCRMTGDTDNRCLDAKRTLAESEGRVSCSC
jgi:hypothetical protein